MTATFEECPAFAGPSTNFAKPKSRTLTTPSPVTLMLAGFRSRWMIPLSCAASIASVICRAMATRPRPPVSARARCDRRASHPSTSSITSARSSIP
jgi:hypothetical protein